MDRENVIKGLEHCKENNTCDGCPYDIGSSKCIFQSHDDVIALLKEQPEIIRCKDCQHWKPPHVELTDGRQRSYKEGDKNDSFGIGVFGVSLDVGINIGGRCWLEYNRGYGRDMRVWRGENDFCSRAEKLPDGMTSEKWWGLSEEPSELIPD